MNRDADKGKLFFKRVLILGGIQLLLLFILLIRLFYLQVIMADKYITLAESNRIALRIVAPERGEVVDRNGVVLASNNPNYRSFLVSEQAQGGVEKTLDGLAEFIPIEREIYDYVSKETKRRKSFVPVLIKDNLTWDDVVRIGANTPYLAGVVIDEGAVRYYPKAWDTSHILGYLAPVAEKDRTGDPLLEMATFRKGKTGVEEFYDVPLRGMAGSRQVEVNVVGREVRELSVIKPVQGMKLALTIDIRLQEKVRNLLDGLSGAVVVVEVDTGEVLALVSAPSFDANIFAKPIRAEKWTELMNNDYKPLVNKAVSGEYSPGSTFKMIVALAALENKIINADTKIECSGYVDIANHRFHCWKHSGHGFIDLQRALAESCDVYFYEIAKQLGMDKIAEMAKRFGLGFKQGIDLPFEKAGLIPTHSWKQKMVGESWRLGETLLAGIGQSYVSATPLQLAMMTARIANDGKFVVPTLVKNPQKEEKNTPKNIEIDKYYLKIVRDGMKATVNKSYGTAYESRLWNASGGMAGKTGTTQVKRITREERESPEFTQREIPWQERNHALFVGYAPIAKPKYAIAVLVEHGGGGASVAAPIASQVLAYALILEQKDKQFKQKTKDENDE